MKGRADSAILRKRLANALKEKRAMKRDALFLNGELKYVSKQLSELSKELYEWREYCLKKFIDR